MNMSIDISNRPIYKYGIEDEMGANRFYKWSLSNSRKAKPDLPPKDFLDHCHPATCWHGYIVGAAVPHRASWFHFLYAMDKMKHEEYPLKVEWPHETEIPIKKREIFYSFEEYKAFWYELFDKLQIDSLEHLHELWQGNSITFDDACKRAEEFWVLGMPGRPKGSLSGHSQKTLDNANLVKGMRELGKTQAQIAEQLEIDRSTVSRLENIPDKENVQNNSNNITFNSHAHSTPEKNKRRRGTDPDYLLARLMKDGFTDLGEQVKRGEKTAYAAAKEAGIIKSHKTVSLSNPVKVAEEIANAWTVEQIAEFVLYLENLTNR